MELAASICGVTLPIIGPDETGDGICFEHIEIANLPRQFGLLDMACGEASFRYIESAVEITSALPSSCIVTAPINKEALNAAGHYYDGHTGMLVHLTKSKPPWMLLESEKLPVVHVSTHVPLRDAIERATIERVLETIRTGHKYLKRMGVENPRIVVAGINPHCGKNGLFRTGDDERLLPAVEAAQAEGINFVWPISADTCITVHIRVHLICSLRNITIRAHPDQTRHF